MGTTSEQKWRGYLGKWGVNEQVWWTEAWAGVQRWIDGGRHAPFSVYKILQCTIVYGVWRENGGSEGG